ncbi:DUF4286 family protein [Bacteroides ihuae]|uniref:DUF4286 family protein n=1 Tax=Bacteroides ihuae TaxID=1852362 RepID=UPI0008D9C2E9|nr:DUF4286 family protein [Bacteroides ihuae]
MLIYNTTYQIEDEVLSTFLIWLKECYIPQVEMVGMLKKPRLCEVLSHRNEDGGSSYSLQWEVESSLLLHRWHTEQGRQLNEDLIHIFNNRVVGFPTLMEVKE